MKKFTIAVGFVLAASLVGCDGAASTSSSGTSEGSTLTGVAAFRAGSAAALDSDSVVIATSPIDTDGTFELVLPDSAIPSFVRCDSAGHVLRGLVPRGRHHIEVDSATDSLVDSLVKVHRKLPALDSATWDSLRATRPGRHHAKDSAKIAKDSAKVKPARDTADLADSAKVKPAKPVRDSLAIDSLKVRPVRDTTASDSVKIRRTRHAKPDTTAAAADSTI